MQIDFVLLGSFICHVHVWLLDLRSRTHDAYCQNFPERLLGIEIAIGSGGSLMLQPNVVFWLAGTVLASKHFDVWLGASKTLNLTYNIRYVHASSSEQNVRLKPDQSLEFKTSENFID